MPVFQAILYNFRMLYIVLDKSYRLPTMCGNEFLAYNMPLPHQQREPGGSGAGFTVHIRGRSGPDGHVQRDGAHLAVRHVRLRGPPRRHLTHPAHDQVSLLSQG